MQRRCAAPVTIKLSAHRGPPVAALEVRAERARSRVRVTPSNAVPRDEKPQTALDDILVQHAPA